MDDLDIAALREAANFGFRIASSPTRMIWTSLSRLAETAPSISTSGALSAPMASTTIRIRLSPGNREIG